MLILNALQIRQFENMSESLRLFKIEDLTLYKFNHIVY